MAYAGDAEDVGGDVDFFGYLVEGLGLVFSRGAEMISGEEEVEDGG